MQENNIMNNLINNYIIITQNFFDIIKYISKLEEGKNFIKNTKFYHYIYTNIISII